LSTQKYNKNPRHESALVCRFFFIAVFAAICQRTVFAVVFLTSLAISVTGTGIGTLTGFIDLLRHDNLFCNKRLNKCQDCDILEQYILVDTGAMTLVITEKLYQTLGLSKVGERVVRTASGQRLACIVTEPVDIQKIFTLTPH